MRHKQKDTKNIKDNLEIVHVNLNIRPIYNVTFLGIPSVLRHWGL